MRDDFPPLAVKVWGDYACFTRPETKGERVSYPVMTPSAARGMLEAIFWKPEFRWQIDQIQVLKPIRYASILRNEINHRQTVRTARRWAKGGGGYDASTGKSRAQRHTLALRDVVYIIRGRIVLQPDSTDHVAKYRDQFRRRVEAGQCFTRPYLGTREFAASFSKPDPGDVPIHHSEQLGLMLFDIDYRPDGRGTPRFFDAVLEKGVMRIPNNPGAWA